MRVGSSRNRVRHGVVDVFAVPCIAHRGNEDFKGRDASRSDTGNLLDPLFRKFAVLAFAATCTWPSSTTRHLISKPLFDFGIFQTLKWRQQLRQPKQNHFYRLRPRGMIYL